MSDRTTPRRTARNQERYEKRYTHRVERKHNQDRDHRVTDRN